MKLETDVENSSTVSLSAMNIVNGGGFFKMQRQELNRYAEIIRQHIEKKLFDE